MKIFFLNLLLLPSIFLAQVVETLQIQGSSSNVRSEPSINGKVVGSAKRFEILEIIQKDKRDAVDGKEDHWYKVRTSNKKIGFVFGHFTSLKEEGKKTEIMTFEEVSFGDCLYVMFNGINFGSGQNNYGNYNLEGDIDNSAPKFLKKKFRVTYNNLFAMISEMCNPELPAKLELVPTIIKLELAE